MKNIFKIFLVCIVALTVSCEEEVPFDKAEVVSFQPKSFIASLQADSERTFEIDVYSNTVSSIDREYNVEITSNTTLDPEAYLIPDTFVIPAGENKGQIILDITDTNAGGNLINSTDVKSVELDINPGGTGLSTPDSFSFLVFECNSNPAVLTLNFDDYPEETYWAIYDAADTSTPITFGGVSGAYSGLATVEETLCLESGDYLLAVFDAYGDGMDGSYGILGPNGNNIVNGLADFGSQELTEFTIN